MINQRKKEIEALRRRIAKLELMEAREAQIKETVIKLFKEFKSQISSSGVTLEEVLRVHQREINRVMDRIAKVDVQSGSSPKRGRKKKAIKKVGKKSNVSTIKIPAGKYTNIPPDPKVVFEVNERGPRPKLLKAHTVKLGLNKFLKECKKLA